jgi:AcrR family transcriptional regulator
MEGVGEGSARAGSRPYRSPRREEQARRTRERILAAARAAFLDRGYAGTSFRVVAAAAEVSVATVEQAFGTKARLLEQVIDVAIAGDDEPVAVLDRPWAADTVAAGSVPEFLLICARVLAAGQQRSAGLGTVLAEGAGSDPALRPLAGRRLAQRAGTAAWIVDGVRSRTALRAGVDRAGAVDTVWLLMDPVVYRRLTEDRDWSPERYERWFADSVERLLLPGSSDDG